MFLIKITKYLGFLFLILITLVVLLVLRLNSSFLHETDVSCEEVIPDFLQVQKSSGFKCIKRSTFFSEKKYLVLNPKGFVDLGLKHETDSEISFLGFSEGKSIFSVLINSGSNLNLLGQSLSVGTDKSSNMTSKYVLGVLRSTKNIRITSFSDNDKYSKIYISDINLVKKVIQSEYFNFSSKASSMSKFIISIVLFLTVFVYLIIYLNNYNSILHNIVFLLLIYGVTVIFFGWPYFTNEGVYDTFDDTGYIAWSHSIGYNLNGLVKNENFPPGVISNQHSWGTGFFYAPAFWFSKTLNKFINKGSPLGVKLSKIFNRVSNRTSFHVNGYNYATCTYITCLAYLYTFLAIFVFFMSFRLITNSNISALFLGFAMFSGTSLIKWTLVRPIFSHVPEMLILSMMTYVFILMYYKNKNSMLNYCVYIILGIILTQIRREDIIFIIPPIYYDYLKEKTSKVFFKRAVVTLTGLMLAQVLLQLSNYLTLINSFWSFPTGSLIQINKLPSLIVKNFNVVLFSNESGFFTMNVFVPLALFSLIYLKNSFVKIIPLIILITGYVVMCMIHQYPTGCEFGNRFLLKIYPIIFCAIAYLLYSVKKTYKIIICFLLAAGCLFQLYQYMQNVPTNMPLYVDLFSDNDIIYPKSINEYTYMLPVLIVFLTLLLLWIYNLYSRPVSLLIKNLHLRVAGIFKEKYRSL